MKVEEPLFPETEEGVAVPLLVTAEVPIGLVVVQVRRALVQLEPPAEMVQEDEEGVRVPDIWENEATTVQLPVTGEVV